MQKKLLLIIYFFQQIFFIDLKGELWYYQRQDYDTNMISFTKEQEVL